MRSLLPRSYYPFLARFPHPTPIQRAAVEPLLAGEATLLLAATASGKTEAFCAPLIERYFDDLQAGRRHLLLVCPTRALVNDAYRRLKKPLQACRLKLQRRTSDARDHPEGTPAALWITTPEGLDSLCSRFPRWLAGTAAVILDELHLLQGTSRGTQVLCLLERLDWICRATHSPLPQRVAATATANRPDLLARLFLGPLAQVVGDCQRRTLRLHYHGWIDYDCLRDTLMDLEQARKVLLFASSRQEAEEAAAHLKDRPPFAGSVFVHHASLSREIRLQAEEAFLKRPTALLCATTTMEVGVDIGDIDWVVLLHPPENPLTFQQRAGRSGRRQGPAQAVAVVRQPGERLLFEYFLERSSPPQQVPPDPPPQPSTRGGILPPPDPPLYLCVVVQQVLGLVFQNPRQQVTAQAVYSRLAPELAQRCSSAEVQAVLEKMHSQGWLEAQGKHYAPSDKAQNAFTRGRMHSTLPASANTVEVRDHLSGKVLGHVATNQQGQLPAQIRLAGRHHQLRKDPRQANRVQASPGLEIASAGLGPRGGSSAPVSLESAQDLGTWMKLGPRSLLSGPQGNLMGHFLGSLWGKVLQRHLQQCYPDQVLYADAYVVAWKGSFVEEVWSREALWGALQKSDKGLRKWLALSDWFRLLPGTLQASQIQELLHWPWVRDSWLPSALMKVSGEQASPLKQLLQRESELSVAGFFPICAEDL